jgi:hypothetical protein
MYKVGDRVCIISWDGNEEYAAGEPIGKYTCGKIDYIFDTKGYKGWVRVKFGPTHCCTFNPKNIVPEKVYKSPLFKALKE